MKKTKVVFSDVFIAHDHLCWAVVSDPAQALTAYPRQRERSHLSRLIKNKFSIYAGGNYGGGVVLISSPSGSAPPVVLNTTISAENIVNALNGILK